MERANRAERAAIEAELKELAQKLGGGWRWEGGVMPVIPVVVLTLDEARKVVKKIDKE